VADYLVELGKKQWFRQVAGRVGLPISIPQALARADSPWHKHELAGRTIAIAGARVQELAGVVEAAGAETSDGESVDALVYDLRGARGVADLEAMYTFFHERVRRVRPNGRVIVVARQPQRQDAVEAAAVAGSAKGFAKSMAKEVGRKGITANVIYVEDGGEHHISGPLVFLLSPRSAFVDGQTMTVQKSAKPQSAPAWERPLSGKTALVTGAARGIGAQTATRLAEEGAQVLALDIPASETELRQLCQQIGAEPLLIDITAADAAQQVLQAAEPHGGLDVLVNNAGITRDRTLAKMSAQEWNAALNVNLKAAVALTEGVLGQLKRGGRTIFLSSIAGIAGNFGQTNYGAAKAGLIAAVDQFAPRFGQKRGTVNAVAPGFIETRLTAAIPFATREAARRLSALGQGGVPRDVAELITFLVSPQAAGVNGQVIRVCGGNFVGA